MSRGWRESKKKHRKQKQSTSQLLNKGDFRDKQSGDKKRKKRIG